MCKRAIYIDHSTRDQGPILDKFFLGIPLEPPLAQIKIEVIGRIRIKHDPTVVRYNNCSGLGAVRVGIIDIEMGNIGSIVSHISQFNVEVLIIENASDYDNELPDILILPGVGAFNEAMTRLRKAGISKKINKPNL